MTNNVYIIGSMIRAHPPQVIVQKLLMNESYTFSSRVPFSEIDSNTHDKDNGAGKSMLTDIFKRKTGINISLNISKSEIGEN